MKPSQNPLRYSPNISLLAARAVELIWNKYPGYSDDRFSKSELIPSVNKNVTLAVHVIRRGQTPSFEELRERRVLGTQRAKQSVPLESVIQAYRCTERVILLDLFSDSRRWPVDLTSHYADLVISTFDLLTQEIIDSYRETSSAMQAARQLVEHDLVLGLASGYPPAPSDLNRWTLTLEIDPTLPYLAVASQAKEGFDQLEAQQLRRWLTSTLQTAAIGPVLIGSSGELMMAMLSPAVTSARIVEILNVAFDGHGNASSFAIGIGEPADDLLSAVRSCTQARDAVRVALAHDRRAVIYSEVMIDILLLRQPDIAEEFARTRLGELHKHPHLVETVQSLLRNNLSQSAVARDLYVHLNTVSHRLKRVRALTGYDPLALADLQQLSMALAWQSLNTPPQPSETAEEARATPPWRSR